ncbi:ABC transporter substrate-binding protein [Paracidovorax valerianellae]|uniref:Iron complex transport system substrate-binding protein n=1 Tax=Paracidovorax valerianellae TaxID=187868 RepID=A0A1G6UE17_9BURK|nr:ABC transporter substrate-binding protein [Paracidovorax valerianellae]MDA8446785.1 ABC transporter substrate-binding protein [Paracidovorax valerianellae]SDD39501.1 iron complex transport system substrate-binding protein [Paracidovorax valerianellae]
MNRLFLQRAVAGAINLVIGLALGAFIGAGTAMAQGAAAPAAPPGFPVTVPNCGDTLRIAAPPKRMVVHDLNMVEMAMALGLQPSMVGVTGITGWYKTDAAFLRRLGSIPELAPKYPTLETLVAAKPDLFFAGWYYGMQPGGDVTPATLARHGIQTLVLTESCAHALGDKPRATMDLLYGDLLRLGTVFGRRAEAERLVDQWRERVRAAARPELPVPPRVFVYDSGEDKPFTAGRAAMPTALIEAAGGRNVLGDVSMSWGNAAWETVAASNPQFIVLLDYQNGQGPEHLQQILQAHPAMRLTDAVRHRRFITLRYAELTPGPANIEAIEKLARALRQPP